jgi:hypothetical protein
MLHETPLETAMAAPKLRAAIFFEALCKKGR